MTWYVMNNNKHWYSNNTRTYIIEVVFIIRFWVSVVLGEFVRDDNETMMARRDVCLCVELKLQAIIL